MKKTISLIMSVLMLLSPLTVGICAASCVSYYIDSENGSDANSGTSQTEAWKTVENIPDISLGAGDKILFKRGGTYECTLALTCSGTKEAPIIIGAYGQGDEKPLLTTDKATEVLRLFDCSYITLQDVEITARNGGGLWIDTLSGPSDGITVMNVTFHDIQNYKVTYRDNLSAGAAPARACIMVKGLPARSMHPVNNLTVIGCEMYDCGNGISLWGAFDPEGSPWSDDETLIDYYYNTDTLVKDCYFHDMDAEAVIVGICDGALVTNCRSIDCCQGEGVDEEGNVLYYTAAMWFWGSVNSTIEYCEIAGQKNVGDGMTVDFDSFSNHCTYQYIYSHDNSRFMVNNAKHHYQEGNTVRYCLSVNDNGVKQGRNVIASSTGEKNFSFYNNTLINAGDFKLDNCFDSVVANNIFILADYAYFKYDAIKVSQAGNTFTNNCYYGTMTPLVDNRSLNVNPGFADSDYSKPESFVLCADSKLIGAGCRLEDTCTVDFYGNAITSDNIGCYGASGSTDSTASKEWLPGYVIRIIIQFINTIANIIRTEARNLQ